MSRNAEVELTILQIQNPKSFFPQRDMSHLVYFQVAWTICNHVLMDDEVTVCLSYTFQIRHHGSIVTATCSSCTNTTTAGPISSRQAASVGVEELTTARSVCERK